MGEEPPDTAFSCPGNGLGELQELPRRLEMRPIVRALLGCGWPDHVRQQGRVALFLLCEEAEEFQILGRQSGGAKFGFREGRESIVKQVTEGLLAIGMTV